MAFATQLVSLFYKENILNQLSAISIVIIKITRVFRLSLYALIYNMLPHRMSMSRVSLLVPRQLIDDRALADFKLSLHLKPLRLTDNSTKRYIIKGGRIA